MLNETKKNCYNCEELTEESETDSDGHIIGGGYHCEKQYQKAFEKGDEEAFFQKMERENYRQKSKVCFQARNPRK